MADGPENPVFRGLVAKDRPGSGQWLVYGGEPRYEEGTVVGEEQLPDVRAYLSALATGAALQREGRADVAPLEPLPKGIADLAPATMREGGLDVFAYGAMARAHYGLPPTQS
jgi:hypothetical protein